MIHGEQAPEPEGERHHAAGAEGLPNQVDPVRAVAVAIGVDGERGLGERLQAGAAELKVILGCRCSAVAGHPLGYSAVAGHPLGYWVIVGGESGPGARPMRHEWVDSILAQCDAAGVAFFFKQWGGVRKHRTGRELNGRTYDHMPAAAAIAYA